MKHLRPVYALILLAGLAMAACVWRTEHKIETVSTINAHIVLDIRQEAAQVEDFVREPSNGAAPAEGSGAKKEPISYAAPHIAEVQLASFSPRGSWFNLSSTAYAAGVPFDADRPDAMQADDSDAAKTRRRDRFPAVNAALAAQRLGEDDHGYVKVLKSGDEGAAGKTEDLAKAENADRQAIYLAIAKKKGLDANQVGLIEVLFAEENRNQLAAGQQFQAPQDAEQFKKFQESELGKRFPDAKAGAWLTK